MASSDMVASFRRDRSDPWRDRNRAGRGVGEGRTESAIRHGHPDPAVRNVLIRRGWRAEPISSTWSGWLLSCLIDPRVGHHTAGPVSGAFLQGGGRRKRVLEDATV
jgi:hypothetical protein